MVPVQFLPWGQTGGHTQSELMNYILCLFKYPAIPRSYSKKFCYEKHTAD